MAKREQFTVSFKCDRCGKEGTATWEENENPVHSGGSDRRIESISRGFERGVDRYGKPEIICSDCGVPVPN